MIWGFAFCPSPLFPLFSFFLFRFAWGEMWIWALFSKNSYLFVGQPAGSVCKERLRHRCWAETSRNLTASSHCFPGWWHRGKDVRRGLGIMQEQIRELRSLGWQFGNIEQKLQITLRLYIFFLWVIVKEKRLLITANEGEHLGADVYSVLTHCKLGHPAGKAALGTVSEGGEGNLLSCHPASSRVKKFHMVTFVWQESLIQGVTHELRHLAGVNR